MWRGSGISGGLGGGAVDEWKLLCAMRGFDVGWKSLLRFAYLFPTKVVRLLVLRSWLGRMASSTECGSKKTLRPTFERSGNS